MRRVKSKVHKKLSANDVFLIVKDEMEYAKKWDIGRSVFPESHADKDKNLETWLLWMQRYLNKACDEATGNYDKTKALDRLRCVLSLGFNAAMYHGLPEREHPDDSE